MHNLITPEGLDPHIQTPSRRLLGQIGLGAVFFSGLAMAPEKGKAQAIVTPDDGLFAQDLSFASLGDDFQIPAYLAFPNDGKKHKVVVVVCEVFGLHDYIRDVCRRLAKAGYCAIAPDFFARYGNAAAASTFDDVRAIVEKSTLAQVLGDLDATMAFLRSQPPLGQLKNKPFANTAKAGITGFCWGGAVVWMAMALRKDYRTGVAWYGRLQRPSKEQFLGAEERLWPIDVASKLKKPVLGLYGGKDRGIPMDQVEAMQTALRAAKSKSIIHVYPEAPHAFHADYRPSYVKADAEDGWLRLIEWFKATL